MKKMLPMRKLLQLVNEVQETMRDHPDSDVDFLIRGRYDTDRDGEISIAADAGAAAPVGADAEFSRHWSAVGDGEFVLRVSRPGTVTADILRQMAEHGGGLTSVSGWKAMSSTEARDALSSLVADHLADLPKAPPEPPEPPGDVLGETETPPR